MLVYLLFLLYLPIFKQKYIYMGVFILIFVKAILNLICFSCHFTWLLIVYELKFININQKLFNFFTNFYFLIRSESTNNSSG